MKTDKQRIEILEAQVAELAKISSKQSILIGQLSVSMLEFATKIVKK
jgi:hypothetical protein